MDFGPDKYLSNPEELHRHLNEPEFLTSLPLLNHIDVNVSNLKDCSLVRFRGMIQDMMDPELYLEKYEVLHETGSRRVQNGKYRDTLVLKTEEKVNYDANENVHGERRSVFVISVPGVNNWVHEIERTVYKTKIGNGSGTGNQEEIEATSGCKRSLDDEVMETDEEPPVKKIESPPKPEENRNTGVLSAEYLLNSPIPDRPSKACIIKIYQDFDSLTLNTLVDVIGFLSVDPALDGTFDEGDGFIEETELQASNPPPSLIPRLHAISIKKLDHINPYFELSTETAEEQSPEDVFKDIRLALSQCLFEDTVAADYLIAHLISTVHTRNDVHALGKLSINLSNIPTQVLPDFTNLLYEVIEMLLPASHYFPMTLENMNTLQFVPKKDYKTNKLTSGILQLAPHTHLVLDETRLQVGKLEAAGVNALKSIADLINAQRLKYNFEFYEIEFDTDVPVMILSEGKSMLPNDCHIPLKPAADLSIMKETFVAVKHFMGSKLGIMRKYLTSQRKATFNINTEDSEMIENAFVEMRRVNEKTTAEDLHSLLVLSRLMALARGQNEMSKEIWNVTLALEAERKERITQMTRRRN